MTTKRGRPPTSRGVYNPHPGRKFGRVSDAEWSEIRAAVDTEAGCDMDCEVVDVEFARQLERELNQLKAQIAKEKSDG
jgi:hypothetical protein